MYKSTPNTIQPPPASYPLTDRTSSKAPLNPIYSTRWKAAEDLPKLPQALNSKKFSVQLSHRAERNGNGLPPGVGWNLVRLKEKIMKDCQGCDNTLPLEELEPFSLACMHYICDMCVERMVSNQLGLDRSIKCPVWDCQEILKSSSKIYKSLTPQKKRIFDIQFGLETFEAPSKESEMERWREACPKSEPLVYTTHGRALNDGCMSQILSRVHMRLKKRESLIYSKKIQVGHERKSAQSQKNKGQSKVNQFEDKKKDGVSGERRRGSSELSRKMSYRDRELNGSSPQNPEEKIGSQKQIENEDIMNVNLPEDSFWPTNTKIKVRNLPATLNGTNIKKNQGGLPLKGQGQVKSKVKMFEASTEARTPLESRQSSFGYKVRKFLCLDS